jgi:hypothetical protein
MTAPSLCFACQQPVLIVTTDTGTRMLEPQPNADGTVEIRPSGLSYRGRFTGARTALTPGWTAKHRTHSCAEPMVAPA